MPAAPQPSGAADTLRRQPRFEVAEQAKVFRSIDRCSLVETLPCGERASAAYELPAKTSIFICVPASSRSATRAGSGAPCAEFVGKEKPERRRGRLVRDDCMAVRCDVPVTVVKTLSIRVKGSRRSGNDSSSSSSSGSSSNCSITSDNSDDSKGSDCNCNNRYYCDGSDSASDDGRVDDDDDGSDNDSDDGSDDNSDQSDDGGGDDSGCSEDDDDNGCNEDDDDSGCNDDESRDGSEGSSGNSYGLSYSHLYRGNTISDNSSEFQDDSSSDSRDGSDSSDSSDDPSESGSDSGMETRQRNKRHRAIGQT